MRIIPLIILAGTIALPVSPALAYGGDLTPPFNVGKGFQRIPTGGNQPDEPRRYQPAYGTQTPHTPFWFLPSPPPR